MLNSESIGTPPCVHFMNFEISENCRPYYTFWAKIFPLFTPTLIFKCKAVLKEGATSVINKGFLDHTVRQKLKITCECFGKGLLHAITYLQYVQSNHCARYRLVKSASLDLWTSRAFCITSPTGFKQSSPLALTLLYRHLSDISIKFFFRMNLNIENIWII